MLYVYRIEGSEREREREAWAKTSGITGNGDWGSGDVGEHFKPSYR